MSFVVCVWQFMDRWSNVSLNLRMTHYPLHERPTISRRWGLALHIITWLTTTLIDVYCCPCFFMRSLYRCKTVGCSLLVRLIDSNTRNLRLTLGHYSNPHNVNWCILFYIAMLCCCVPYLLFVYFPKAFVAYCVSSHDPIEADIVSYTKIYGQDKLILTH